MNLFSGQLKIKITIKANEILRKILSNSDGDFV